MAVRPSQWLIAQGRWRTKGIDDIAKVTIERYATGENAEREAILNEKPLHNITFAEVELPPPSPDDVTPPAI